MATTEARSALTTAGMSEEPRTARAANATPLRDSTEDGGVRSSTVGRTRMMRRPAISARRSNRSSSSVLPLNMQPVMTWIQPGVMCRQV